MQYAVERSPADGIPVKASISFSVTGEYAAVYRFIHRLNRLILMAVIESLNRVGPRKYRRASSVVFHVTVATFLRPNQHDGESVMKCLEKT